MINCACAIQLSSPQSICLLPTIITHVYIEHAPPHVDLFMPSISIIELDLTDRAMRLFHHFLHLFVLHRFWLLPSDHVYTSDIQEVNMLMKNGDEHVKEKPQSDR